MRIFIAGATGVIGRRVLPLLIKAGHSVTGAVRSEHKRLRLEQIGASAIEVDLFNREALAAAVSGHDAVINMATHIPAGWRIFIPGTWRENDRIRREASANLVDAALAGGAKRFVQESFAPVYPGNGADWINESVELRPVRYNRTVLDAEASANRFALSGGDGVILRFGYFYGPDASQTLDMIKYVRKGWAAAPGPAESLISSVSHDDASAAVLAALNLASGAYNVCDDEPLSHREFYDSLAEVLGVPRPRFPPRWISPIFGSLGRMLARSQRISNKKFKEASGWSPKYPSIREGWHAVIESIQNHE